MCRLGGLVLLNKKKAFDEELQTSAITLLVSLQSLGRDAWGFYLEKRGKHNNKLYCGIKDETMTGELYKQPGSVDEFFIENDNRIRLDNSNLILLHTRADTHGSPKVNDNNHPFMTKDFILAHNGVIRNYDELKRKHKIKTTIECDSYIIIRLIQKFYDEGKSINEAIKLTSKELSGTYACWLYHKSKKKLYLFKHNNPIHVYKDDERGLFAFASEADQLTESLSTEEHTIGRLDVNRLVDDKIYKLNGKELNEVGELSVESSRESVRSLYHNNDNRSAETSCLSPINNSLVDLFRYFEPFDKDAEVKTIIGIVKQDLILLVKPAELENILDTNGFLKYKEKQKVHNSEYWRYTISPRTEINKLVSNLVTTDITTTKETNGAESTDTFKLAMQDIADSMECELILDESDIILNGKVDNCWNKLLRTVGLSFKKTGILKVKNSVDNRKKFIEIQKKMGVIN